MPEFDRTAAALAELAAMDDDETARCAEITFVDGVDHGILRVLRESLAEEYRQGHVDRRDRYRVAATIGEDLANRADTLKWFGVIRDMLSLETTTEDFDRDRVAVRHGGNLEDVVEDGLRLRFTLAAHALLTVIEDEVDEQEYNHPDDDTDTDAEDTGGAEAE